VSVATLRSVGRSGDSGAPQGLTFVPEDPETVQRLSAPVEEWVCEGPGTCVPGCRDWGICHCGCGGRAPVAPQSRTAKGYVKGRPHRWLPTHHPKDGFIGIPIEEAQWRLSALEAEGLVENEICRRLRLNDSVLYKIRVGYRGQRFIHRSTMAKLDQAFESLDAHLRRVQVPMLPLRVYMREHGISAGTTWGIRHRYCKYIRQPHVSLLLADEMAVSLGVHPSEVWSDWHEF